MKKIISFIKGLDATTAIEYAIIAGLIAVLLVVSLTTLGSVLKDYFDSIAAAFT